MENTLYHYTNSHAIINILNTGLLRATHARYFDDASDCRYAIEIARELESKLKSDMIFNSLEKCIITNPRYVVSLSERQNDPYLWEKYGQNGHGACIVIDSKKLESSNPYGIWDDIFCCYDQEYQITQLKEIIPSLTDSETSLASMNQFWKYSMSFKNTQYARESETRKIFTSQPLQYLDQSHITTEITDDVQIINRNLNQCIDHHYFDEKMRPFMNLHVKESIKEVVFGPHFKATFPYFDFLKRNYSICQIGP